MSKALTVKQFTVQNMLHESASTEKSVVFQIKKLVIVYSQTYLDLNVSIQDTFETGPPKEKYNFFGNTGAGGGSVADLDPPNPYEFPRSKSN